MKTFYIVKKAPTSGSDGHLQIKNGRGHQSVYDEEGAMGCARKLAGEHNGTYVVLKAVAAFEPSTPPVVEVKIEEEPQEKYHGRGMVIPEVKKSPEDKEKAYSFPDPNDYPAWSKEKRVDQVVDQIFELAVSFGGMSDFMMSDESFKRGVREVLNHAQQDVKDE